MISLKKLNDHIVYTIVKSQDEALELKEEAQKIARKGETVIIFFDNRHFLYLAPGQDPYQVRKHIEDWQSKEHKPASPATIEKKKLLTNELQEAVQTKKKRASLR